MTGETGALAEHQIGAARIEGAYDSFDARNLTIQDVLEATALAHAALAMAIGGEPMAQMCAQVLDEWVAKNEAAKPGAFRPAVLASLGVFRVNLT